MVEMTCAEAMSLPSIVTNTNCWAASVEGLQPMVSVPVSLASIFRKQPRVGSVP